MSPLFVSSSTRPPQTSHPLQVVLHIPGQGLAGAVDEVAVGVIGVRHHIVQHKAQRPIPGHKGLAGDNILPIKRSRTNPTIIDGGGGGKGRLAVHLQAGDAQVAVGGGVKGVVGKDQVYVVLPSQGDVGRIGLPRARHGPTGDVDAVDPQVQLRPPTHRFRTHGANAECVTAGRWQVNLFYSVHRKASVVGCGEIFVFRQPPGWVIGIGFVVGGQEPILVVIGKSGRLDRRSANWTVGRLLDVAITVIVIAQVEQGAGWPLDLEALQLAAVVVRLVEAGVDLAAHQVAAGGEGNAGEAPGFVIGDAVDQVLRAGRAGQQAV